MKKFRFIIMLVLIIFTSGCFNKDSMENIEIKTTAYPIEYVTNRLYEQHSEISSIYPNGMEKDYVVSNKLLKDYSKSLTLQQAYHIITLLKNYG